MTDFQQRDMSGVLFKNDKNGNDKRPDYRGEITIHGALFELAAWIKEGKKGKFMSLSIKPKEEQQEQAPPPRRAAPPSRSSGGGGRGFDDMDSDIPFAPVGAGRAFLAI
jgi:hypothetical protein